MAIGGTIKTIGTVTLYNLDNEYKASDWVREEIKGVKTFDAPQLSSACNVKQSGRGNIVENAIGFMNNSSNNIYFNTQGVSLFTSAYSNGNGLSITKENFMKCVALFTARRSIKRSWEISELEYIAPNTEHKDYEQWNNDALIYSLFESKSNQSSLRDVDYKGENWNINNEFFFMSVNEMKELADTHHYDACYNDIKRFGEDSLIYNTLKSLTLSEDASEVLELAKDIVRNSFKYREMMNEENPQYNLHCYDAGWYQVKLIAKEHLKDDLKKFTAKYKAFEDRMREGVYKFGFLKG